MPTPTASSPGAPLRLLHAGSLDGRLERTAVGLVRALRCALDSSPHMRGHIQLDLLGGGRGAAAAARLAASLGIGDAVSALPQVPQSEALRSMDSADVLVLINYAIPLLQIPGKTPKYMGCGKPILGIMGECEAADIIRRSGLGTVFGHEDTAGMARHIEHLWHHRGRLSDIYQPDWDYISQFSRSAMASRLDAILRNVCSP